VARALAGFGIESAGGFRDGGERQGRSGDNGRIAQEITATNHMLSGYVKTLAAAFQSMFLRGG